MIAEPPSNEGAVKSILACPLPAVAVPTMGASGTLAGVILLDALLAELVPAELVAVTVNVYGVPLVNPGTIIEPLPAWLTKPVNPPGEEVAV